MNTFEWQLWGYFSSIVFCASGQTLLSCLHWWHRVGAFIWPAGDCRYPKATWRPSREWSSVCSVCLTFSSRLLWPQDHRIQLLLETCKSRGLAYSQCSALNSKEKTSNLGVHICFWQPGVTFPLSLSLPLPPSLSSSSPLHFTTHRNPFSKGLFSNSVK